MYLMSYEEHLSKLYRPSLGPNDRSDYVCLDKNEPPFSAFGSLEEALTDVDMRQLRAYPELYDLYVQLAGFVGVKPDNLLITQGSEQALRLIFDVYLSAGDEVVYLKPSFAMYDVFAYLNMATIVHVAIGDDLRSSLDSILSAITKATKLFVVANPHNFTGSVLTWSEIRRIAEHTARMQTVFLIDEAYFHYYVLDTIDLLDEFPNVLITRSFSKAFGLAGCRVGYAISNPDNIELLRKMKPIDEIGHLASVMAKRALANHDSILRRNVDQVSKWKDIFRSHSFPAVEYIETHANFILVRSQQYQFHIDRLLENKILPKREFPDACLHNCIRFSVLDDATMQRVLNILSESQTQRRQFHEDSHPGSRCR